MKWTQEEAIEFECAREIITSLIAIQTRQIVDEEQSKNPDAARIDQLRTYRSSLVDERTNLHVQDHDKIAKVIKEYGVFIRTWREQHNKLVSS